MPIKGFAGFFNTAARTGAAQGRHCGGLGCPWDALNEAGTQPVAGRCGWEAEEALWDIVFIFLWLQGSRPEECAGLSTATHHLSSFTLSSFYGPTGELVVSSE